MLDHVLTVNAETYTPLDEELIAKGTLEPLVGTPLDFTTPTPIGSRIEEVGGYDHNYNVKESQVFHPKDATLRHCTT